MSLYTISFCLPDEHGILAHVAETTVDSANVEEAVEKAFKELSPKYPEIVQDQYTYVGTPQP